MNIPKLPDKVHALMPQIETPAIVYFESIISETVQIFKDTMRNLNPTLFYAVKAASFPFIFKILQDKGISGFDVASVPELLLTKKTQAIESRVHATAPGLTIKNIEILHDSGCVINCDSVTQVRDLLSLKNFNSNSTFGLRLNPGIKIKKKSGYARKEQESRLGIRYDDLGSVQRLCSDAQCFPIGIHLHLEVGVMTLDHHKKSLEKLIKHMRQNAHIAELFQRIKYVNLGGGLIPIFFDTDYNFKWKYFDPSSINDFISILHQFEQAIGQPGLEVIFELGEFFTESAGFFVTSVVDRKLKPSGQKVWILDTNIHHLWGFAKSGIEIVSDCIYPPQSENGQPILLGGNSCYSDDTMGILLLDSEINESKVRYLIIPERGAYYFSRASLFNGRLRPNIYLLSEDDKLALMHKDDLNLFYKWWE